jgi:hypothetical protein
VDGCRDADTDYEFLGVYIFEIGQYSLISTCIDPNLDIGWCDSSIELEFRSFSNPGPEFLSII